MIEYFFAILAALFVIDTLLTDHILKNGGTELNPIIRALAKKVGSLPALIGVKVVAFGALYVVDDSVPVFAKIAILVFYVGLCVWNLIQTMKMKKA